MSFHFDLWVNGRNRVSRANRPAQPSPLASGHESTTPSPADTDSPAPGVPAAGAPNRRSPAWYAARRQEEIDAADNATSNPPRPSNIDELVAQFMDCTSTEVELAYEYIQNNGWDLEVALREFWMAVHPESSDDDLSSLDSESVGTWEDPTEVEEEEQEDAAEEGMGGPAEASTKGEKRSFADENPNVDRSPAIRGQRDESKLTITLMRNGQPYHTRYRSEVNWNDVQSIHLLNRFRQQVFRRNLDTIRARAVRYLPEEDQFLVQVHREALQTGQRRLNWASVTERFNARFQGRILEGSDQPRPARTRGSLQSESARVEEITEMTGKIPRSKTGKSQARPKSPPPPPPPRGRDNGNNDDDHGPAGVGST